MGIEVHGGMPLSKPNQYPGDTDPKRLSRTQLYKRSRQLFEVSYRPTGMAIVLAGPDAGDFGCLKHVLGFKPKEMLFVDLKPDGLIRALERSGDVQYYEGDILDALHVQRSKNKEAAFINLDFCEKLSDERIEAVRRAGNLLTNKGLLFYTFYRGRETGEERQAMGVAEDGPNKTIEARDFSRCVFVVKTLLKALGSDFELVFLLRYSSQRNGMRGGEGNSPMAVVGFQKMPLRYRDSNWKAVLESNMEGAASNKLLGREVEDGLRISALALAHEGKRSKEIQDILNVPAARVAAWIAVDTARRKKRKT